MASEVSGRYVRSYRSRLVVRPDSLFLVRLTKSNEEASLASISW